MEQNNSNNSLLAEIEELRQQLEEATDTIQAIRTGQVDALVVKDTDGHQLYTLKTADQTYRVFIEKMNEGAATINREGIVLYCNTRFALMVDAPLEDVIGMPILSFVPEKAKEKLQALIDDSWEDDCKKEITIKDGGEKDMHCLFSCTTIELDSGTALSLIITDLTILKATEKELKLRNEQLEEARSVTESLNESLEATVKERTHDLTISREHFKLLTNNIVQMTWTNLPDGNVNAYNQRWYDYTGLDFAATGGFGWTDLIHPDDLAETAAKYTASLQSGEMFEVENRYRRHDGVYRWHLNRSQPLRNDEGEIIFWVGTATDIEDQKREMERKDEFIGIASHELKTPLTSLKGYLQLMAAYKKEELPAAIKNYVTKAGGSLNKLQSLINDLLDVSKIKAGGLEYNIADVNVNHLIGLCMENAMLMYPHFAFSSHAGQNYIIRGNQERLEQVLMNLVNNAVKYSYVNKTVEIDTARHGNYVRISVIDKGIGLSHDQKNKIFERFYRVEDKKNMASGLGMGLYISHEIIQNHKGRIGVESEPGKGSTFYIELPLAEG
ncbi:PAS domain-containing sensor histidine kinase [Mucilaginibacter psychrotolerans]|uniref:histidine kinase n=1 Tax=Mucilaginibacter psychrotolerans TaxID=1524096 RepID=A0A4Y8S8I9_9SPHI|nr:ATP-binding protein [Mucilaginibacter psychrotolerans]TFF35339.1 PAS domain S-box protein [Mucilaginibacter psychrotolerans]